MSLTQPQTHEEPKAFTASGAAVDAGTICAAGTLTTAGLESVDGKAITEDEWAQMFDSAAQQGQVAEMYVTQTWTCDDGASFTIRWHNRFDFATFEFEGQQDVGTWEIAEASSAREGLTGSGQVTLDWEAEEARFDGEVQQ